jgi:8-oxo-dGTP diphosphatase
MTDVDVDIDGTPPALRPELAVGAIIVDDDALLLVRRGRPPGVGRWSVPGGRVERGETLAHAVVREVLEETGVECVCGELIGWVERFGVDHHFVILDFAAIPLSMEDPVAGDDADEVRWVPLDEVSTLDLVEGLAEFLHEHGIVEMIA